MNVTLITKTATYRYMDMITDRVKWLQVLLAEDLIDPGVMTTATAALAEHCDDTIETIQTLIADEATPQEVHTHLLDFRIWLQNMKVFLNLTPEMLSDHQAASEKLRIGAMFLELVELTEQLGNELRGQWLEDPDTRERVMRLMLNLTPEMLSDQEIVEDDE